jgi:hypothetical protein
MSILRWDSLAVRRVLQGAGWQPLPCLLSEITRGYESRGLLSPTRLPS